MLLINPTNVKTARDIFRDSIIAQDDDDDYSESGYVAVVIGDWDALARYSHCSCNDTWEYIESDGWDWSGTVSELLKLAKNKLDPSVKDRKSSPEDCDYDHLMNVYSEILSWHFGKPIWSKATHNNFSHEIKSAIKTVLLCFKRKESLISMLPKDILFYLFEWISTSDGWTKFNGISVDAISLS